MGHRLNLILAALLALSCQPTPPVTPGDSEPRGPGDGSECAATCSHWESLDCEESKPSKIKGITCEERCQRIEEFEALPHTCIQAAETCEASRECEG